MQSLRLPHSGWEAREACMYGDIEGRLEMLPNEKHKELRSGKDCNQWGKVCVMCALLTLVPERCPVPLHIGSMVAFKPAVAFT